ncbi:MAG: hypothetical protein ACJ79H_04525 [Myxococcales bacterium]
MQKLRAATFVALVACGRTTGLPSGSPASSVPAYRVTDLGTGNPNFIDAEGRISGIGCSTDARCGGAVYEQGSGWSLAPLPQGAGTAVVKGTDSRGNMALDVHFPGSLRSGFWLAYIASPLQRIPVPALTAQDGSLEAGVGAINSAGHVVGWFADGLSSGAYFYDGSLTQIGKIGEATSAAAINSRDQVAGSFLHPDDGVWNSHAFRWENGVLQDLGTVAGTLTEATAINDSGVVAGWGMTSSLTGMSVIFRWDGQMHVLGCPQGTVTCHAFGINARGDIVGDALISVGGERFAFVWRDGVFYRLDAVTQDASGWRFETAMSVNDTGQVVGVGSLNGAENRAYLLTPR